MEKLLRKVDRKITPRGYQQLILDLLKLHTSKGKNVLLELDCGMGKRVITYELLTSVFSKKRIILIVLSSSSLFETKDFLMNEYGGVEGFNWIGPGISNKFAQNILKKARVVLCTPQKLNNIIKKTSAEIVKKFDLVIINEVDKLIRRMGSKRVLVHPWSELLELLEGSMKVGMSGTLRDTHYVLDNDQIEMRQELGTLLTFIPNTELILMDYLAGTDISEYAKETTVEAVPVEDPAIIEIAMIIDEELRAAFRDIRLELEEEEPEYLEQVKKIGPQALLQAPVSESLKGRAQSLTLVRKYLFSMIPQQFRKFLWKIPNFDPRMLPITSQKIVKVVEIAKKTTKTVVLCSYIKTAETISSYLTRAKIKSFVMTGRTFDKNAVLQDFRNFARQAVLIMSPVGERDIDLPEADSLVVYDCIRTIKTVYQRIKRIRGGHTIFLYYDGTYEAKKVQAVLKELIQRYPWTTKLLSEPSAG